MTISSQDHGTENGGHGGHGHGHSDEHGHVAKKLKSFGPQNSWVCELLAIFFYHFFVCFIAFLVICIFIALALLKGIFGMVSYFMGGFFCFWGLLEQANPRNGKLACGHAPVEFFF